MIMLGSPPIAQASKPSGPRTQFAITVWSPVKRGSLDSIRFSQFNIRGLIAVDDDNGVDSAAEAEATVGILNSAGEEFIFTATAPSVSRAGMQATVRAAEYFVNSERTFVRLHEILEHYRAEGRTDLVEKYTQLMTRVVSNTSYSAVVERIKNSM